MAGALDRQLDRYAARLLETGVTPAAGVAVVDADGLRLARVHGAGRDGDLFQVGSIGKSFTAVVALQLAAEGRLDLHAPLSDYLPWFRVRSPYPPISAHHLLTHTAGLIMGAELATASNWDVVALAGTEAGFAPGAHFWYSNVGYRALGLVLERISGRPYPELVQRRVLDPLGMRDSTAVIVHETRRRLAPGHAPFYDDRPWRREHGLVPATWIESAEADGSVCCTAADLGRYLLALMRRDERLLDGASMELLLRPHAVDDQDGEGAYGYGLMLQGDGFGHSGSMIGYRAHMWCDARAGLGAVALVNGIAGARVLCQAALALARGEEPPDPAPEEARLPRDDGSAPREQAPYVGHYRSHNPWLSNFRVGASEGALWLADVEGAGAELLPLTPLGEAEFRVGRQEWSPERLRFDAPLDGRSQRALLSGAPYHRTFTP